MWTVENGLIRCAGKGFGFLRYDRQEYADFGEFQLLAREGDVTVPRVPAEEPLRQQSRASVEALDDRAKLRSGGRVGAEVVRVLAAINESMTRHGAPVAVASAEGV